MSRNFERVKKKLILDMEDASSHSQEGWANIMLKAARRCTSEEDQKDFFRYILNPDDSFDIPEPVFMEIDTNPKETLIESFYTLKVQDEEKERDVEMRNTVYTNGNTTYITTTPRAET